MLKGVIDCPELPLNVSRSYLQNSGYVSKISAHIVKKVGDKLSSLYNTAREEYEGFWQDIKTFILYGCLRDQKFYDRLKDIIIYKNTEGAYKTLGEYIGSDASETINVYYTNSPSAQAVYVGMHRRAGREVLILENIIETQFISLAEMKSDKPKIKFVRVDSDVENANPESSDNTELIELFREAAKSAGAGEKLKIEVSELADDKIPALLTLSEQSRRMADMMKQYKMFDANMAGLPDADNDETLVINAKNALIQKLAKTKNREAAKYIYMLSLISKRELSAAELEDFIDSSIELCDKTV